MDEGEGLMSGTVQLSTPQYRIVVAMQYWNASRAIFEGLRRQCGVNDFHFLISLRSFIEYTRRGIWFLLWASEERLRTAEKLTFNRSGSLHLVRMDEMINEALGLGRMSHLRDTIKGVNEPFIDCLHALTHGNSISVRFLAFGLKKIFQTNKLLVRAELELHLFTILFCRRAIGEGTATLWKTLAVINNRPDDMKANAKIAAHQFLSKKANPGEGFQSL
jgi:hypothetical protein